MSFDAARVCDRIPDSPEEKARLTRRIKLLALAGALDDIGLRARIVEYTLRPTVLRCWDPSVMGLTLSVTCERSAGLEPRWEFRYHPAEAVLGDADEIADPEDALDAARLLAASLARPGR